MTPNLSHLWPYKVQIVAQYLGYGLAKLNWHTINIEILAILELKLRQGKINEIFKMAYVKIIMVVICVPESWSTISVHVYILGGQTLVETVGILGVFLCHTVFIYIICYLDKASGRIKILPCNLCWGTLQLFTATSWYFIFIWHSTHVHQWNTSSSFSCYPTQDTLSIFIHSASQGFLAVYYASLPFSDIAGMLQPPSATCASTKIIPLDQVTFTLLLKYICIHFSQAFYSNWLWSHFWFWLAMYSSLSTFTAYIHSY